jgi:PAS domain S-box-containing protein
MMNSKSYHDSFINPIMEKSVEKDLNEIEKFFIDKEAALNKVAKLLALSQEDEYIYEHLDRFKAQHPAFEHCYYSKESGRDYLNDYRQPMVDGRTRPWYKEAVENKGFNISPPYIDVITEEYVITLSIPVYKNNILKGVFGVDFLLSHIIQNTAERSHLKDVSYILKNNEGNLIYYNQNIYEDKKSVETAIKYATKSPEIRIENFYLNNLEIRIWIIFHSDPFGANMDQIGFEMSLLFLIIVIIAVLIAFRGAKKLSEPLEAFKKRIDDEASFNDLLYHPVTWEDEFVILFDQFNALSRKINLDRLKLSRRIEELQEKNSNLMEKNMALESIYKNLKQLDKKIRKSRHDYESILENIKGMIWVIDHTGNIVFVNQELLKTLSYEDRELIGKSVHELIYNNYSEHFDVYSILKKRDYNKIDLSLKHHDESHFLVEANTSCIYDDSGDLIYIYGICQNVQETKKLFYDYSVKIQEQNLIMELTETASMNVSMVQVVQVIFDKINSIFGWSVGTIRFLNDRDEFELVARTDIGTDYIVSGPLSGENSCLSHIVKSNEILYAKSIEDLPVSEEIYREMILNGYVIIFIPVGNSEIGKGIITLVIDKIAMIEKEDILKSFTNTIILVVERALGYEKLKNDYIRMIKVLAEAGDDKDSSSIGHSNRVANYSKKIGEKLYLDDDEIVDLEICGLLHDIGKIGISDEYLMGDDFESIEKVKEHPIIGKNMLKDIGLSQNILEGIEMHHLNFDLSGYPLITFVESLPLFARIIQVADTFDNLKEKNPTASNLELYEIMAKDINTLYCPQVMRVFKSIILKDQLTF